MACLQDCRERTSPPTRTFSSGKRYARGVTAEVSSLMRMSFDVIEVVVARLADSGESLRASAALLSELERQRANRFIFERDRRRFIIRRSRLRQLLAARLDVRPESVDFVHGPHGKPALAPRLAGSGVCFNMSGSQDLAVYAFSRGRQIGVDVEAIRAVREADDIAERFFSARESEAYQALSPRDRPLGFINCWTRKEAFVKALGEGLSYPCDAFDVALAPGEPPTILRVGNARENQHGWRVNSFSPAPGFVAAIVVAESRVPLMH